MKVRIKKSPSHRTGDQFDYSAVTHPTFPNYFTSGEQVKNTIGGVPREMANIEAEGGETILGDLNNDGNIEHFTITGKRHSQGGVPMNVPPGSFIFSDTKKMRIKDREVLDYFGMGGRKGGYTPAEISKRYKLNEFMQTVNSTTSDPLAKRTAEDMLNKNMTKLAELAAYQEMMKGNQPPAVSQQILGGGEEEMRDGGMVKMPGGGSTPPKVGTVYYLNGQPIKLSRYVDDSVSDYFTPNWASDPGGVYFKDGKNQEVYLDYNQFKQLRESGKVNTQGSTSTSWWTSDGLRNYEFSTTPGGKTPGISAGNYSFNAGDVVTTKDGVFKISNPQAMPHPTANYSVMELIGPDGKKKYMQPKDIISLMNKGMAELNNVDAANPVAANNQSNQLRIETADAAPSSIPAPAKNTPAAGSTPKAQPKPQIKAKPQNSGVREVQNLEEIGNFLEYGGLVENIYDFGGYVFDPMSGRMIKMAEGGDPGEKEITTMVSYKGRVLKATRVGNQITVTDPQTGEVVTSYEKKKNINTYDPEAVKQLEKDGVKLTSAMDISDLSTTPGHQGMRTDNERIFGKRNWKEGKEYDDFKTRHAAFLSANPNFDPTKETDVKKFQKYYNDDIRKQAKAAGYDDAKANEFVSKFGFDESRNEGIPNAFDGKFGQYTWSRPTFSITPKPGPDPQPDPDPIEGAEEFDNKVRRQPGGMWIQNQNAILAAMSDDPYYGAPVMTQVDMVGFNPQLEEYSAKNAMLQSNLASLNNQFAMTGDAATSRAAMLGAVGRANEQGAGIIENIQNRNVGTTNQAAQINAEINNRENVANAELRKKYLDESNIYGQQLNNFFNTKRTRVANAFNRGLAEMQNTNMVESMFPQYQIDRFNGAVVYDPTQGLSFDDDVAGTTGSQNFNPENYSTAANQYYNAIKKSNPGISDDVAYKQAFDMVEKNFGIASRAQKGAGFMDAVSRMRQVPQQRFGGVTPSYAVGGPFFYDDLFF